MPSLAVPFAALWAGAAAAVPHLPDQFTAMVSAAARGEYCTAPLEYPACDRAALVAYDGVGGRAAVTWVHGGDATNETYIRRYDLGREYRLHTICPEESDGPCEHVCERSALPAGAALPRRPALDAAVPHGAHEYAHASLGVSLRTTPDGEIAGVSTPAVDWVMSDVVRGAPDAARFVVPHAFFPKSACRRVPGDRGFPYIHLLGGILPL